MSKPKTLFDFTDANDPSDWEAADVQYRRIAQVVFSSGLDGCFDYIVPERFYDQVVSGKRLLVPLGKSNRPVVVYCVKVSEKKIMELDQKYKLKEIINPIDSVPLISPHMLQLAQWISNYYLCPLGQVLEAILPAGVRDAAGTRLTKVLFVAPDAENKINALNLEKRKEPIESDLGINKKNVSSPDKKKSPDENTSPDEKTSQDEKETILTSKQRLVFEILKVAQEPMTIQELARASKCSLVPIQALKKKGLIRTRLIRRKSSLFDEQQVEVPRQEKFILNPGQKKACDRILKAIRNQETITFLLHGITGSGKTEVYIQAIEEIVTYGKQAIILVPEISLTPQTVYRFRQRFDSIAVLHSHLTDIERHSEWMRIASGSVQVVVGARSAIFAPLPHLGLIVIDEEHESSFKQNIAPRYHAREVAQYRAQQEKIPLILGSATPSLESWQRQENGEYELLTISERVLDLSLPKVYTIDLRNDREVTWTRSAIHPQLYRSIQEVLKVGGQVILFLNRRGYSTHIQCPQCGNVLKCPDCDVALTHHRREEVALCHYCDYQIPVPTACPSCGYSGIRFSGFGTEKLQQELEARFTNVPILRMDTDTMQGHGTHERALTAFRQGEYRILLGTQMIAKGLDFPNVLLVGVINADTALHFPDFRAAERTFYLITQVAGRTGRGERGGSVIIQTYNPEHPAIVAASHHDYLEFIHKELPERLEMGYPPYTSMIRFIVRGPNEAETEKYAQTLAGYLRTQIGKEREERQKKNIPFQARILGPAPAPFAKLKANYRFHFFICGTALDLFRKIIRELPNDFIKKSGDIEWIVDVDPLDTL